MSRNGDRPVGRRISQAVSLSSFLLSNFRVNSITSARGTTVDALASRLPPPGFQRSPGYEHKGNRPTEL